MKHDERDLPERFWSKVNKTDLCWLWTGPTSGKYGSFEGTRAHRVSFHLTYKRLTKGLFICHRCDNPSCVRPDHLFEGTASDNSRDCYYKGRSNLDAVRKPFEKGNTIQPPGLVTTEQVKEIRELYASGVRQKDICIMYGFKRNLIWKIVHNISYVSVL